MPSARFSLTRLQVYLLLIDPELGGLSQSRIADILDLTRPTISGHVEPLVFGEFVKAVEGCKCPILYEKGKESPKLDALVLERRVRDTIRSCVGHASPNTSDTPTISPPCQDVSRTVENARVHANGSVSFNVEKVGDLHELVIKRDGPNGKVERIKLFKMEPEISEDAGRGSSCYNSHIYVHGKKVRLQFWQGKEKNTLRIWPTEKNVPPSLLPSDDELEKFMESQAQDVANFISKYGGWRFGLPSFNGQIEIASQDERILSQIPDDIKRVEGVPDAWVDGSPPNGKREFEVLRTKKARAVFEFDKTADKVDGHAKRIYVLESDSKHIVALLENLVKAQSLEAELLTSAVSRSVEEMATKAMQQPPGAEGSRASDSQNVQKGKWELDYVS